MWRAATGGPQESTGGLRGSLGGPVEDTALCQVLTLFPGAAPGPAAGAGAQLLGAVALARVGPGPLELRDSGDLGAQLAAEDPHQQAAGDRRQRAAASPHAAATLGTANRGPAFAVRRRSPSHQGFPCQMLEPGDQYQGVRLPQRNRAL